MSRITENTTLAEVAALPGYEQIGPYLFSCDPQRRAQAYQSCPRAVRVELGDAAADGMLAGLTRLDEVVETGAAVAHDIWSADEKAADPGRTNTKLLFLPGEPGMPFVVVCPGGAYNVVCADSEGLPIAAALNEAGYNAFVLCYRIGDAARLPGPVEDLAQAVRYALAHADELQVAPSYAVVGFSAGAHLAGLFASVEQGWAHYGVDEPQAAVLCYPAVDLRTLATPDAHHFVREMLDVALGDARDEVALAAWSVNEHVDAAYPPTYAWACEDDDVVPIENLRLLDARLAELGVEHETCTYPFGGHGLVKPHDAEADAWMDGVVSFLAGWL